MPFNVVEAVLYTLSYLGLSLILMSSHKVFNKLNCVSKEIIIKFNTLFDISHNGFSNAALVEDEEDTQVLSTILNQVLLANVSCFNKVFKIKTYPSGLFSYCNLVSYMSNTYGFHFQVFYSVSGYYELTILRHGGKWKYYKGF